MYLLPCKMLYKMERVFMYPKWQNGYICGFIYPYNLTTRYKYFYNHSLRRHKLTIAFTCLYRSSENTGRKGNAAAMRLVLLWSIFLPKCRPVGLNMVSCLQSFEETRDFGHSSI